MANMTPNIPLYGHIAARLREWMAANSKSILDLAAAMDLPPKSTTPYTWLSARGAPRLEMRQKLSKVTGIPEADLMRREPGAAAPPAALPVKLNPAPGVTRGRPARGTGDVLAFSVTADGQARIRLDATLPLEIAKPLLRMILDAGVVFGTAE